MNTRKSDRGGHAETPRQPIATAKLSKRFCLSLDEGLYLVSGVYDGAAPETAKPAFAERIAAPEGREAQWQRIRAARADGRTCDVFMDAEHHAEWKRHWNLPHA